MALKKTALKKKTKKASTITKVKVVTQSSERRQYKRIPLKMAVKYKSVKKGEISRDWQTASQDVSAGGLSMTCALKLRRGQLMMINLFVPKGKKKLDIKKMPDLSIAQSTPAAILSRVAYCKVTGQDRYQLGVEFLDLDKANRKLLKAFLVQAGLVKTTSRLYS